MGRRGEIVIVSVAPGQHFSLPNLRGYFSDNSPRISFYVFNSPKSTGRRSLRLPYIPETSENAFKRLLGAKKRKSRKSTRAQRRSQIVGQHRNVISATRH